MRRITLYLLIVTTILMTVFVACNKDDNSNLNNNTEMLKDATFYHGTDFEEDLITYLDTKNDEVSLFAFKGFVIVYFQDNVDIESANQIITQLNGSIVEKIPAFNYYLIQVTKGSESDFIEKIQSQEIEYVSPFLIFEPNYYTAIIDDYRTNKTHGSDVLSVYNGCSHHLGQTFLSKVNVGKTTNKGIDYTNTQEGLNFLITDNEIAMAKASLVNMSFSPKRIRFPNDHSYYSAMKKQIKQVITRIKKMKKYRTDNIVVTIAAGNDGLPIYDNVIKPLTNGVFPELSSEERSIMKNNILIVGAIDTKDSSYSNTSTKDNAFAMVDISDLSLYGTSFAAPRALCYISQIMDEIIKPDGSNLTATEALAAVKEAIQQDPKGELDVQKAIMIAKKIYGGNENDINTIIKKTNFKNTKWNVTITGSSTSNGHTIPISGNFILDFTDEEFYKFLISDITDIEDGITFNSKAKIITPSQIEIEYSVKGSGLSAEGNCILKMESSQVLSGSSKAKSTITVEGERFTGSVDIHYSGIRIN